MIQYYVSVDQVAALLRKCDSVARTGTFCTGSVRTEYVLILSVLPVPSVLLVYSTCHPFLRGLAVQQLLATHPPGFSGSHIYDIYVIQCCTSTRHPTSHIHHTYLYKLIKPPVITQFY